VAGAAPLLRVGALEIVLGLGGAAVLSKEAVLAT
jgi:hypothetical protein